MCVAEVVVERLRVLRVGVDAKVVLDLSVAERGAQVEAGGEAVLLRLQRPAAVTATVLGPTTVISSPCRRC